MRGVKVGVAAAVLGFIMFVIPLFADQPTQSISEGELGFVLEAIKKLPPLPPENLPPSGMFYSVKNPEWPPFPANVFNLSAWDLGEGGFLLDDRTWKYEGLTSAQSEQSMLMDVNSGGGSFASYTSDELWLEVPTNSLAVSNQFSVILHNTVTNQPYAILTKSDLTWSNWTAELRVTGVAGNATPAQLPKNDRTNLFIWARTCSSSNLIVDASPTPQELAQLLVGGCVTISNVSYTGAAVARGTFTNGICSGLAIDNGVILSSGDITNAIGPNNTYFASSPLQTNGDTDLDTLVGGSGTIDATVLEFDVISPSNSITLTFNYIFASEEYPEYINHYNDPMAIFVSTNYVGTNWINTNNIALVPGTTNSVSVSTINENSNPQFYVDNGDPKYSTNAPVANVQYDGFTTLLSAQTQILPGITYHIKIAIADFDDNGYDSAVFIKAATQCP